MSASPGNPLLRSRIAERLTALKGEGSNALARLLGVSGSTTSRWETPQDFGWYVIELATRDEALRDAVIAYLTGEATPSGEAVRVNGNLFQLLTHCTELMHEVATSLRDGRVDRREAMRLLKLLRHLVTLIETRVIPDLEAAHAR
jgi:hypothetical protein